MLDEQSVMQLIDEHDIDYTAYHHVAVFTVDEVDELLEFPDDAGTLVKNLLLCDQKKREFFLVTCPEGKPVNLKELAGRIPVRHLRFANVSKLDELGIIAGSVTPLALLNDTSRAITMVFDEQLRGDRIGVHPLVNTGTVFIAVADLERLIVEHGNHVVYRRI